MKIKTVLLFAWMLLGISTLQAQTSLTKTDRFLITTDINLRAADAITSHNLFTNPCHCFNEGDPIAPNSGNWGKQILFQSAMSALVIGGSRFLVHKHHPKWAKTLLILDIIDEGIAAGNNAYTETHSPAK